ncbi:MAG: sensor domain-containing diguanylate cyclase [Proteobacteria bacterium]|nr:sensor domain-containing diguanylate cyclase [Pseudomonadota bacterium]MBU1594353.1 sensor domain-containing diguanylate cyclase [Pseudomonadota bacterium]
MDIQTLIDDGASGEQIERMFVFERYAWMTLSYDMAMLLDVECCIEATNSAWARASGHSQESLHGKYILEFMDFEERERILASFQHLITGNAATTTVAFKFRCADGEFKRFNWNVLYSPDFEAFFCVIKDLSDVNNIRHVAYHDTLTGVPNRLYLTEILPELIAAAQQNGSSLTYLLIDLFEFKVVNDTLGHQAGDIMLQVMAERLRQCLTNQEYCARIGSAKFVLLQTPCGHQEALRLIRQVIAAVNQPEEIDGREARVGALIGVVLAPADADTPAAVMKLADHALEEARRGGKDSVVFAHSMDRSGLEL